MTGSAQSKHDEPHNGALLTLTSWPHPLVFLRLSGLEVKQSIAYMCAFLEGRQRPKALWTLIFMLFDLIKNIKSQFWRDCIFVYALKIMPAYSPTSFQDRLYWSVVDALARATVHGRVFRRFQARFFSLNARVSDHSHPPFWAPHWVRPRWWCFRESSEFQHFVGHFLLRDIREVLYVKGDADALHVWHQREDVAHETDDENPFPERGPCGVALVLYCSMLSASFSESEQF